MKSEKKKKKGKKEKRNKTLKTSEKEEKEYSKEILADIVSKQPETCSNEDTPNDRILEQKENKEQEQPVKRKRGRPRKDPSEKRKIRQLVVYAPVTEGDAWVDKVQQEARKEDRTVSKFIYKAINHYLDSLVTEEQKHSE